MNNELGIYIHIPFCRSKCFYCNFCSKEIENNVDQNNIEEYINAVCAEILVNSEILSTKEITSIYIGGGTPSVIDTKYIEQIMNLIYMFNVSETSENTIEVNPIDCTQEKLKKYFDIKINRISVGVQSTNIDTIKKIGRENKNIDIQTVYNNISKAGFENISMDVIIGLPDETVEMFANTIENMLNLGSNLKHISAYSLELHEETKLGFLVKNKFLSIPDEEIERKMKHLLDKKLKDNKFSRYEISNYALNGFESKHNLKYWTGIEYLGFGVSAASYISNTRYTNISDITKYIFNISNGDIIRKNVEDLDELEIIKEYIILRLRLKNGVNRKDFKLKFKREIDELYKPEIQKLVSQNLIINNTENGNIYLSDKGEDFANIVWQEFI